MKKGTLSIAVMSGKGGVGKSNLSLNLGYSLFQRGQSVLLMDCDMGLANLDVLLGITPEGTLQDALMRNARLEDVVYHLESRGQQRLDILPAASGVPELVDMDKGTRSLLLERLEPLLSSYDTILLDLGAGINDTVQAFARMAAIRIMVLTPEPTSLTDAYALIKVLNVQQKVKDFLVIVNQAESKKEQDAAFQRLSMACDRFLGFQPVFLGGIPMDSKMPDAVRQQKPLCVLFPEAPASKAIGELAHGLMRVRETMPEPSSGQKSLRPLD